MTDQSANDLGYMLQHVASQLAKQSDQILQEQLGIGYSQFKILRTLQTNPRVKQRQIASDLGQTEASVSRQIKLMVEAGLLHVNVNPHNRREHVTVSTAKGVKLTEAALEALAKHHATALAALGDKQRNNLTDSLELLRDSLE